MPREVRFEFDPFEELGEDLPDGADRREVLEACADYIRDSVLEYVGSQNSPVSGHGSFPSLSKEYAKRKREAGHPPVPNLELSGEMLSSIRARVRGTSIVIDVAPSQADKADGHCNHSGDSDLPLRRFIPAADETFKKPIIDGIKRIIRSGGGA